MKIGSILGGLFNSLKKIGRSSKLNISFKLSIILGKKGLKVKLKSKVGPAGKLGFFKRALLRLRNCFRSKADSDLQIYFEDLLRRKSVQSPTKSIAGSSPMFLQLGGFTRQCHTMMNQINREGFLETMASLDKINMQIDAKRTAENLRFILKIKARGSKEVFKRGIQTLLNDEAAQANKEINPTLQHGCVERSKLVMPEPSAPPMPMGYYEDEKYRVYTSAPSAPPFPQDNSKSVDFHSHAPSPSAPEMTPEQLAYYNAGQVSAKVVQGIPISEESAGFMKANIPVAMPISTRATEANLSNDPVSALQHHTQKLQHFLQMYHARVSHELQPSLARLHQSLEDLSKASFETLYKVNKKTGRFSLKSAKETMRTMFKLGKTHTVSNCSEAYEINKSEFDRVLNEIKFAYSFENILHHFNEARQIIHYFQIYGYPEGMQGVYSTWQDIDNKISNTIQLLDNLSQLSTDLDNQIGNPNTTLIPHLKDQLKHQLDYLSGVKSYHHAFEDQFAEQHRIMSGMMQFQGGHY